MPKRPARGFPHVVSRGSWAFPTPREASKGRQGPRIPVERSIPRLLDDHLGYRCTSIRQTMNIKFKAEKHRLLALHLTRYWQLSANHITFLRAANAVLNHV